MADSNTQTEAAVFQSMALLATLTAAGRAWHHTRERRAGRDPSVQEHEAVVRPWLRNAVDDLRPLLMRLHASLAYQQHRPDEPALARAVRRFDDLMLLGRLTDRLQGVHQRLLSLYPAVDEQLVEDARMVHQQGSDLLGDEAIGGDQLAAWVDRALAFVERLDAALDG